MIPKVSKKVQERVKQAVKQLKSNGNRHVGNASKANR